MDNNLISNILQLERTHLIRGGTGNSYAPFELKLQLHGQVNNPYTVSVKSGYKTSASISVDVPAYTEKSWTTPGTYTWTVPAGVTKIRVAVCGGGGGAAWGENTAGYGGTSFFDTIQATGGTGGKCVHNDSDIDNTWWDEIGGSGGSPNGNSGKGSYHNKVTGGTGFALDFNKTSGTYGQGGSTTKNAALSHQASGGSGGYNTNYILVTSNSTISLTVGSGGAGKGNNTTNGTSGFVLIAYGQGIE